jgi:UDP-N-acetylglucosamine 2-epimerase
MGLDENRIKLTGTPIIEEIITSQKIKISKKKKYLLKSGKTICLALSNPNKEDDIKLVAFFSDIKNKYGEIDDNFLIKLHPARDRSKYKWIEEEFELQIIPSNIPYNDFIIFTDVLLTHSSGIATECLFYNKKVGILDILSRSSGNGMMLNIFYDTLLIKKTSDFEKLVNNQTSLTPEEIYYKTGVSASIEICKYIKNKL